MKIVFNNGLISEILYITLIINAVFTRKYAIFGIKCDKYTIMWHFLQILKKLKFKL
mgnify:CR=1 FL=1